jgi:hypothetical protein
MRRLSSILHTRYTVAPHRLKSTPLGKQLSTQRRCTSHGMRSSKWARIHKPPQNSRKNGVRICIPVHPSLIRTDRVTSGYGNDRYFGVLDGQHLIHCLNLLRQWSHFDYYFPRYTPQSKAPPLASAHKDHCVAVLLEHLTCQPSLNIFTYYWIESQPDPSPNFEINRKCQNHGDLLKWQMERELAPEFRDLHFDRPEWAKFKPADPQSAKIDSWVWNGSAPI